MDTIFSIVSKEKWMKLAHEYSDYNYMGYWEYARIAAERIGCISEHVVIKDDFGNNLAILNARIKYMPFKMGGIAYISGGPIFKKAGDDMGDVILPSVLTALKSEYVQKRGLVLRISQRHKLKFEMKAETEIYKKCNFVLYGKLNPTIILDLFPDAAEIRKKFHQKWRNLLNKSEKQGIEIISSYNTELFDDFKLVFNDLLKIKKIKVEMDDDFYFKVQKFSSKSERFNIAVAYKDGNPVGGVLSNMAGDTAIYILGASNDLGRKFGVGYLLQWHTINEAKKRGCHWYDLGGIDKINNPGVYRFKSRMGGDETCEANVFQYHASFKDDMILFIEKCYKFFNKKIIFFVQTLADF